MIVSINGPAYPEGLKTTALTTSTSVYDGIVVLDVRNASPSNAMGEVFFFPDIPSERTRAT
jgi:hypothetical protein